MKKTILFAGMGLAGILMSCTQGTNTQNNRETTVSQEPARTTTTVEFKDFGPEPFVFDIEAYTTQNETFRTTVWTGSFMQMTVMTIQPGEDIGQELHTTIDQFIRGKKAAGFYKWATQKTTSILNNAWKKISPHSFLPENGIIW